MRWIRGFDVPVFHLVFPRGCCSVDDCVGILLKLYTLKGIESDNKNAASSQYPPARLVGMALSETRKEARAFTRVPSCIVSSD